jgi:hypothetical protein
VDPVTKKQGAQPRGLRCRSIVGSSTSTIIKTTTRTKHGNTRSRSSSKPLLLRVLLSFEVVVLTRVTAHLRQATVLD